MNVNVLGTKYTIQEKLLAEEPALKNCDGFCDFYSKGIVHAKFIKSETSSQDVEAVRKKVIRHELIHAFLYESGLTYESDWASNEEMIDFFAIQLPKIIKTFEKAKVL
jgi:hypothetical protein